MELQRFVWEWSSLLDGLAQLNAPLANRLERSCRPIAADRRPDGRLVLVFGCWVPADRAALEDPSYLQLIQGGLKQLTDERMELIVAHWPAGDGEPGQPPDTLADVPEELRDVGLACGGALNRSFFNAAVRRGFVFECQYPVLNYRLDFALPRQHVGVEIDGWNWRAWAAPSAHVHREREQDLDAEGWSIFWFTGEEILRDVDKAVAQVSQAAERRSRQTETRPPWQRP